MTTPRTIAGRAALSALRPQVRKALSHTVAAIEAESVAPFAEALRRLAPVDLDAAVPDAQTLARWPSPVSAADYRAARALLTALSGG